MKSAWGTIILASFAIGLGAARADVIWTDAAPLNSNAATDTDSDYYMQMATDGAGNVVAAWTAAIPSDPHRDFDIYVARSSSTGGDWSAPAILDPLAVDPPENEDDFDPVVVTDGAGHWLTAWYTSDDHGGTLGTDTDILVSRSDDNGATWTPSIPLNADATTDAFSENVPSLATDGNGLWVAVWRRPKLDYTDYDIIVAHSTDLGETWAPPELLHPSLSTDFGDDLTPSVATDRAGHWIAAWSSQNNPDGTIGDHYNIHVSCSTNGLTWTTPVPLNSDAADTNGLDNWRPRLATDGAGRWLAVWDYGRYPGDYDIRFAYSDDHGMTWSPVAYLNSNAATDTGVDYYPIPATDGNGNWIVVWQSKEPLAGGLIVSTDYDIFYAASTDNGETWSPVGFVNSYAPFPGEAGYDRDPQLIYLGGCRWLTVWGSNYNLNGIGGDYDLIQAIACFPQRAGDQDCDGDVDLFDFRGLQECFGATIPLSATCAPFDVDTNGAVNHDDVPGFAAELSGPAN